MATYLITGVSRGLGFEFVRQLSSDQANTVIGLVRDKRSADKKIASELNHPKNVHILQADINDYAALKATVDDVTNITGGSIDFIIGNAGISPPFSAFDPIGTLGVNAEALDRDLLGCFNTNVLGNIHLFNLYLPLVLKGRVKKVIAISTGMADIDLVAKYDIEPAAPYSISKAALNAAVAKFAAQYRKEGVLFMTICPGMVATEMNNVPEEYMPKAMTMMRTLLEYAPHFTGPVSPEASVTDMLSVINNASISAGNSGAFLSHFGNKTWL